MSALRKYADLILGILFVGSVVLGYYKDISYMSEYCFISGMIVGIGFIASFFSQQSFRKPLKNFVYLAGTVDIFVIFIATVAIRLNLEGAFWFIHIINPILIAIYWFVFCGQNDMNWKYTLTVVVFPMIYMLFSFVLWKATGSCPFPASLIFMDFDGLIPLVILIALALVLWVLGFVFYICALFLFYRKRRRKTR